MGSDKTGLPLFTIVGVAALCWALMDWNDNHLARGVSRPVGWEGPTPVDEAFARFLKVRQSDAARFNYAGRLYPVVVIAAEGGGARAAFETALILEQMRLSCPDLLHHTFAVIGISGGAVGAMLGSAAMRTEGVGDGCKASDFAQSGQAQTAASPTPLGPNTQATRTAGIDMLRPMVRGMLLADLPMHLLPVSGVADVAGLFSTAAWKFVMALTAEISDRTAYLEHGIDLGWRENAETGTRPERLEQTPFSSLWAGPESGIPALVLLTTDVETGRRVAASHLRTSSGSWSGSSDKCLELDDPTASPAERARLVTLAELLPSYEPSATAAALLSGRFPGASAAGRLPCANRVVRLVDGGIFENSGLTTAMEMLRLMRSVRGADQVQLVVLQIENSRATTDWSFASGRSRPAPDPRWLPCPCITARPDRADAGRLGGASLGASCQCVASVGRWHELRGGGEGAVLRRRHDPNMASAVSRGWDRGPGEFLLRRGFLPADGGAPGTADGVDRRDAATDHP